MWLITLLSNLNIWQFVLLPLVTKNSDYSTMIQQKSWWNKTGLIVHLIDNTWRESLYKGVQYVDKYLQNFEMSK